MLDARISSSNIFPVCRESKLSYSTRISWKLDDSNTWLVLPEGSCNRCWRQPGAKTQNFLLQLVCKELYWTGKNMLPVKFHKHSYFGGRPFWAYVSLTICEKLHRNGSEHNFLTCAESCITLHFLKLRSCCTGMKDSSI